ncbi:unnamed protein product [Chrysoparadoxa australica]
MSMSRYSIECIFAAIAKAIACLAASTLVVAHAVAANIYVAPNGSDSNSGTITSPLATLEGARAKVATMNSNMSDDIFVNFRGGVYNVTNEVSFGVSDSGSNGYRIV